MRQTNACLNLVPGRLPDSIQIARECRERWDGGCFLSKVEKLPPPEEPGLPWVPYEGFMEAQLVRSTPGEPGIINVRFPAGSLEDNALHTHPQSDRVIVVTRGAGLFIARRSGRLGMVRLMPGDAVFMPRGVLHTFAAGEQGMAIRSLHNPFVSLKDPDCMHRPALCGGPTVSAVIEGLCPVCEFPGARSAARSGSGCLTGGSQFVPPRSESDA